MAFALAAGLLLAACSGGGGGGGGGGSTPPGGGTPPSSGPIWTQGVYQPASTFINRCENPRSGVDIEGNRFPDRAGSLLEEKFWLRSWTNETYLWNTEVIDRNPSDFGSRTDYFAVLRTTATTASGEDRDDFHFSQPTEEYLEQRNSAPSSGYGARIRAISATVPRDYRILYTEPNSPASTVVGGLPNFVRGARIISIDGADLINGTGDATIDTLNNGLFPATAGETHVFVMLDPGAASPRTVTITSANIAPKPVNRFSTIDTPTGRVGYMLFNTFSPFSSEADLANAVAALNAQGISDLVVDLRYNGGGLLAVASQLSYMIAGDTPTRGRTFERLRFNAASGGNNPVTGQRNDPIPFYDQGLGFSLSEGTPLTALNLRRVFILSTGGTCSASEAVINGLRGVDFEVILIGDITCGKPFGFYPQDNCGETYYTIQFQGTNDKGFGDYADGFVPMNSSFPFGVRTPGCVVADDFSRELGDTSEALLAAALQYRRDGSCPTPPPSAVTAEARGVASLRVPDPATATLSPPEPGILETNRDMRMPDR